MARKDVPAIAVRYRHTESMSRDDRRDAMGMLSGDELDRCRRFHFDEDRRDFAAAHSLLRRTLASAGSLPADRWRFEPGEGGKPRVAGSAGADAGLSFNLAHTRGLVACAVGRGFDVGIDVERVDVDRDVLLIAESYFAPIEREWLAAAPASERPARFIEIWTLKEAWLKATGAGLTGRLGEFAFSFEDSSALVFHPPSGVLADDWRFALFDPGRGFRLAVAVRWNGASTIGMTVRNEVNGDQAALQRTRGIGIEPASAEYLMLPLSPPPPG